MADAPPTPRPSRKPPKKGSRQEPVTPDTPGTPTPNPLAESAAEAAAELRAAAEKPRTAAASRAPRPTQADKLQQSLEELLSLPALAYSAVGDEWGATFFAERAPVMAEAWVTLGKENAAVMRVLRKLTTTSAWGGVIIATGGTVLPVLIHHKLIPDLGIPLPGPNGEAAPLVPPPPGPPTPPGGATPGPVVGRQPPPPQGHTDMTPPLKPDQPPGVVTVAGSNNRAVG